MADSADTAVRAVSTAITTPVEKVSGLAAGVAHGFASFRKTRDFSEAKEAAQDAARRREQDLAEDLRAAGRTPPSEERPTPTPTPPPTAEARCVAEAAADAEARPRARPAGRGAVGPRGSARRQTTRDRPRALERPRPTRLEQPPRSSRRVRVHRGHTAGTKPRHSRRSSADSLTSGTRECPWGRLIEEPRRSRSTGRETASALRSADAHDGRAPRGIPVVLRVAGAPAIPVVLADPAAGGPVDAVHHRRHAAAEAVLLGRQAAAGAALHDRPEVPSRRREGHRPRRGRAHRPPRVDVRDARQLLVRRLLQGRRRRPRVGVRDRAPPLRPGPALGERLRRRPGARDRRGRGGRRRLAAEGHPARAHRRRSRARRTSGAPPARPAPAAPAPSSTTTGAPSTAAASRTAARTASAATATSSSGTSSSWSSTSPPTAS